MLRHCRPATYRLVDLAVANRTCALLTAIALLMFHAVGSAQDDPFSDFDSDATDLLGDIGTSKPAVVADAEESAEPVETNPAVLAIVESKPESPRELIRAVGSLINLDRPQRMKGYLEQLSAANPDTGTLVELHREFGSALFLRLIRNPDLQPEGTQIGNAVLDAAQQANRDPRRIAEAIERLRDPSPGARRLAMVDLYKAEESGLRALIGVLADPQRVAEAGAVKAALVELGEPAVDPVVAALASGNRALRAHSIEVLGQLGGRESTPFLLVPYFSEDDRAERRLAQQALLRIVGDLPERGDAVVYLDRLVTSYLSGQRLGDPDPQREVTVWDWDPAGQSVLDRQLAEPMAALELAGRVAEQLHLLDSSNPDFRRQYYALMLEAAQRQSGLDRPLSEAAAARVAGLEADQVEDLLRHALRSQQFAAATAAIGILGRPGALPLLLSGSGSPTSLVAALQHPDQRVKFAAAMAIRNINPEQPYPGSSYYPQALVDFIRTAGTRRVVVAHPRIERAQTIVSMLADLGFEADIAQRARAAHSLARQHADYEFLLVSDGIDWPPVGELLQHLRRDPRTAHLPVGVMARGSLFSKMQRLVESDPLATAVPTPNDVATLSLAARRLLASGARYQIPYEVRIHQAAEAMDEFRRIASESRRYEFYDLMRFQDVMVTALEHPGLATAAAEVLGQFGSPAAQRALVAVASQYASDLPLRQAAAAAFSTAVQQRGILLTKGEILRQYDLYNQSASLDRGTRQVLGAVLDAIEAPSLKRAEAGDGS